MTEISSVDMSVDHPTNFSGICLISSHWWSQVVVIVINSRCHSFLSNYCSNLWFLLWLETTTSTGPTVTTTGTPSTTSHMYLVITTAIWMNKTSNRPQMPSAKGSQNVPFGVFGIMLPYKTVRSTHFSNLCVSYREHFPWKDIRRNFRPKWTRVSVISLTRMVILCLSVNQKEQIERWVKKMTIDEWTYDVSRRILVNSLENSKDHWCKI